MNLLISIFPEFYCKLKRPIWKSPIISESIEDSIEYNYPERQLELILDKLTDMENFFLESETIKKNNNIISIDVLNSIILDENAKFIPIDNTHFVELTNLTFRCRQLIFFFIYFYRIHDIKNEDKLFKEVLSVIENKNFSYLVMNPLEVNEVLNFLLLKTLLIDNQIHNSMNLYCRNCNGFFNRDHIQVIELIIDLKKILFEDKDRRESSHFDLDMNKEFVEDKFTIRIKNILNKFCKYPHCLSNYIIRMVYEIITKLFKIDLFINFVIKIIELREKEEIQSGEDIFLKDKTNEIQEIIMILILNIYEVINGKENVSRSDSGDFNLKKLFQQGVNLLTTKYLEKFHKKEEKKKEISYLSEYSHFKLENLLKHAINSMLESISESNQSLIITFLIEKRCFKKVKKLNINNFKIILKQFEDLNFSEYAAEFIYRKARDLNDKNLLFEISLKFTRSNVNIKNRLVFCESAINNQPDKDKNIELKLELENLKSNLNLQKYCYDELKKKLKNNNNQAFEYLQKQLENLNKETFDEETIKQEYIIKYSLFESYFKYNIKFNFTHPKKIIESKEMYFDNLLNESRSEDNSSENKWYIEFQNFFDDILKMDIQRYKFLNLKNIIKILEDINDDYEPFINIIEEYGSNLNNIENERENFQNEVYNKIENWVNEEKSKEYEKLINICWTVQYFMSNEEIKIEDLYRVYKNLTYNKVKFYNGNIDSYESVFRLVICYLIIIDFYLFNTIVEIKEFLSLKIKNISKSSLVYFKNLRMIENEIVDFCNFIEVNSANLPSVHLVELVKTFKTNIDGKHESLYIYKEDDRLKNFFNRNIRETVSNMK